MGRPPAYDPIAETEYLIRCGLDDAEQDDTLRYTASTYDPGSDRLSIGVGSPGIRIVTFAPLLVLEQWPLNALVHRLLQICEEALEAAVEIEFAVTLPPQPAEQPLRFGFLQVRPMALSSAVVDVPPDMLRVPHALVASETVMGNGIVDFVRDIVYVRPDRFEARHTPTIAQAIAAINRPLVAERTPYVLIGFGRWGSSDPWLGIPVRWPQIAGARVIVEASPTAIPIELSQGSHFFHNLASFGVSYFCVEETGYPIRWDWLAQQEVVSETELVRHVRARAPLHVRVDGRSGRGLILPSER
jgi:hypothetical protein